MNKIIVMLKDSDKVYNTDIYNFIENINNKFIICNVTKTEFNIMRKQIKEYCLEERFDSFKKEEYNNIRYMAYVDKNSCIKFSDYNSNNKNGYYYFEENELKYEENKSQFLKDINLKKDIDFKIYTTETYEDMINHFEEKSLNKIKKITK